VPYRQVVLTTPKRLRVFFRFDRRLLGELPSCVWRALRLYLAAAFGRTDLTPGAIGFLQTAGELLGYHPHLHMLLADGALLPDGTFRTFSTSPPRSSRSSSGPRWLRLLVERGKIDDDVVQSLLAWRHSGISVDASVRVEKRSEAARLGRSMIRCPPVLERLSWDQLTGEVVDHARPGRRNGAGDSVARWGVLGFIARILGHLPKPHQQLLRYWGCYNNAARGRRRRLDGDPATSSARGAEPDQGARQRRLTWSHPIRKVYEIETLLCSFCGAEMRIVAFIVELSSLRRILQHLGCKRQRP